MPQRHPGRSEALSVNHNAAGGPLPLRPLLLELRNSRTWAVSLSALVQSLIVSLMIVVPLFFSERPPAPEIKPIVILPPQRGLPSGELKTERGGGPQEPQHRPRPNLEVPIRVPDRIVSDAGPGLNHAGPNFGPAPDGPPFGDPNGVENGIPILLNQPVLTVRPPEPPRPVRVGGKVRPPKLLRRVEPDYPRFAQQSHVEGTVVLEALIWINGRVEQLTVQSGHPALVAAAREAVAQWVYEPTYLNDVPVPVLLTVTVDFRLQR